MCLKFPFFHTGLGVKFCEIFRFGHPSPGKCGTRSISSKLTPNFMTPSPKTGTKSLRTSAGWWFSRWHLNEPQDVEVLDQGSKGGVIAFHLTVAVAALMGDDPLSEKGSAMPNCLADPSMQSNIVSDFQCTIWCNQLQRMSMRNLFEQVWCRFLFEQVWYTGLCSK